MGKNLAELVNVRLKATTYKPISKAPINYKL